MTRRIPPKAGSEVTMSFVLSKDLAQHHRLMRMVVKTSNGLEHLAGGGREIEPCPPPARE